MYDELMMPLAFSTQRASPSRRLDATVTLHETSWHKRLKAKASVRSLKSKGSSGNLQRKKDDFFAISDRSVIPNVPRSPPDTNLITAEALPPPVPPIPLQYALEQSDADVEEPSGGDAIAPFLAYEQYAPDRKAPTTPMSSKTHNSKVVGSTTTLTTTATTPSTREFPSGPDDPFWDNAVARVKEKVRREQADERREHKAIAKTERRFIRELSTKNEGHFKWAKLAIESLIGKYDEHGWLPKKDPKDFDDDDWEFVLEVLAHKDTKKLRDRLFQRPEWIEADNQRQWKYEQTMQTDPTPEYLAARKAQIEMEQKEYRFRKELGMLTKEELKRERLEASPTIGLGISNDLEPVTPVSTRTSDSSKMTGHSSHSLLTHQPGICGWQTRTQDYKPSSKHIVDSMGDTTLARHNVEQMTGVFHTDDFDPRLSRLGSEEVKQYINKKSTSRSEPLTPTPIRPSASDSHDLRRTLRLSSTPTPSLRSSKIPVQSLKAAERTTRVSNLLKESPSLRTPPLGVHPAFRGSQPSDTPRNPTSSRIPRLRSVRSTIPASNNQKEMGRINFTGLTSPGTDPRKQSLQLRTTSNPVKPYTTTKAASEPTASRFSALPPPTFDLSISGPSNNAGKATLVTHNPSITASATELESEPTVQHGLVRRQGPLGSILHRLEKIEADLAQYPGDNVESITGKSSDAERGDQLKTTFEINEIEELGTLPNEKDNGQPHNRNPTLSQAIPQPLARLSRITTAPAASDFSAAMREDSIISHDATSSSIASFTPRDRLTAKRSGVPVTVASLTSTDDKHNNPSTSLSIIEADNEHPSPEMPVTNATSATGKWEVVIPKSEELEQKSSAIEGESATLDPAPYRVESVKDLSQLTALAAPARKLATSASENNAMSPKRLHTPIRTPYGQHMDQRELGTPEARADTKKEFRSVSENVVAVPVTTASPGERSFSLGHRRKTNSEELDASFDDVINAWQQSSPTPTTQSRTSYTSFNNQETQVLRSEVGLEPIREHIPGNAKHPNHRYTWNTKKTMCRRIHNPGIVLPSLPSPTPGQPTRLSEYAAEFFAGSPYTNEPAEPQRCASCESFCCRFAELISRPKKRTTDLVELNERRRIDLAVATMRTKKPNGVEEWDAFLECSQCKLNFCPECITLCSEELCQEPVCTDCREGNELCRIHNII